MTRRILLVLMVAVLSLSLSVQAFAQDEHPLKGQTIDMAILGIGGWVPSSLGVTMANDLFASYAKDNYGYTVNFTFQESPFTSLFQRAASSLATRSNEYNIVIADSQWLGAFAEPGWIVDISKLIKDGIPEMNIPPQPGLVIEPYSSVVKDTYMVYPDGTDNIWGLPEEGDVIVLYVRTDMINEPTAMAAFKAQEGFDVPTTFDGWTDITMDQFEKIAKFFTHPDKDVYGTVLQYSREYDYMTMFLYPFMWSQGGQIWDAKTRTVWGILNSDVNADAMVWNKRFLDYQPPGALSFGISQNIDNFTQGKAATAFQWAAVGPSMITPELKDKVMVVPPPGFKDKDGKIQRVYSMGGQPWVINAYNSPEQMRVAVDFLNWWYQPETQWEYARRGGNPTVAAVVNDPKFDTVNPWNAAFKYMLQADRARDFWHEPNYAEMLAQQQEGFTAYASGQVTDAKNTLNWIACQQQKVLFENGRSEVAPPAECDSITLQ